MGFMALVRFLWYTYLRYYDFVILKFNKAVYNYVLAKELKEKQKRIVFIGDSWAEGIGQYGHSLWGRSGGVATKVVKALWSEPTVKFAWDAANCGVAGSTTADWVPDGYAKLGNSRSKEPQKLFEKIFTNPKYACADIVCIQLGTDDERSATVWCSPKETVENIKSICEELTALGKHVIIANISTNSPRLSKELHKANQKRNELLAKYLEQNPKVKMGPDLNCHAITASIYDTAGRDGIHLNTKGYDILANQWMETILPAAKSVEWDYFKRRLSGGY